MRRILVAVDGSECAQRALRYFIDQLKNRSERPDIHVLHVKLPLPETLPGIIEPEPLGRMWQEEADAATRSAHDLLAQAGLPHKVEVQIGDPAEEIAQYAKVHECDEIVMGTRGLGTIRNLILGSVAYKVVHLTDKPVLLVK
jgi:nucleotide-binding universal stress UspA family protein